MKIKLQPKYLILSVFLCLATFGVGYELGAKGFQIDYAKGGKVTISRVTPIPDLDFSLFWKVWDNVSSSYYDKSKLKSADMVYGAISGMVASLGDPYTLFLQPSQNKLTNEDLQGNFSGVGIELGFKGTQLAVIAPLSGTPAQRAGIKPGDLIVGIKDEAKKLDIATDSINLGQAVEDIRGPIATKVTLTIVREGSDKPFTVDLIREQINVPSVKIEYLGLPVPAGENKDVVHISILKFGGDTLTEWQKAIQEISKSKITKVILDLRNNPGGYLQDAVDIAGEFLSKGSVAVIQENGDGTKHELKTDREGEFVNSSVVVLVNGGSASASEILAGSLRDNRGVKLVGEKTFGKGTIQEPQDLDGGSGLHVTIAKWLTPNGTWVHGTGLTPDVKVTNEGSSTTDAQLDAALKLINSL